jgi:hypothetical protein
MSRRELTSVLAVLVLLMVAAPVSGGVIYRSIPSPLPPSLVSQSFQAQRNSEFGDLINFGGTDRNLTTVTVAMVTWGYFTKYSTLFPTNTGGWTEPAITLNLFNVDNSGASPAPGGLIASITESAFIPWRHEPSPASCLPTLWLAPDGCHNGEAFDITFDFTSLGKVLPNQIIFGIAYNTQSAGLNLGATGVVGPYNDLNVGLNNVVTVGSNPNAPLAYLSGTLSSSYFAGGPVNVFRLDTGGAHANVAIQFGVPEPGTVRLMLAGGLLLLAGSIRRRQRVAV